MISMLWLRSSLLETMSMFVICPPRRTGLQAQFKVQLALCLSTLPWWLVRQFVDTQIIFALARSTVKQQPLTDWTDLPEQDHDTETPDSDDTLNNHHQLARLQVFVGQLERQPLRTTLWTITSELFYVEVTLPSSRGGSVVMCVVSLRHGTNIKIKTVIL